MNQNATSHVTTRLLLNQFEKDKNFVFRGKYFPINFKLFKLYSSHFRNSEYKGKKDLIFEYPSSLSENSFACFINACQGESIQVTHENAYDLLYLSEKFEVGLIIQEANKYIENNKLQMPVQFIKYKLYSYDKKSIDQSINDDINDEVKNIGSSLTHYLENKIDQEDLISFPIPILYNIFYTFTQNNNENCKFIEGNQEIVINFLLEILKKHGSEASILFSFVDFEKQNLSIFQKIKNICFIENVPFQYEYMNDTFSKTIIDLINENIQFSNKEKSKINFLKQQVQEFRDRLNTLPPKSNNSKKTQDNDDYLYEDDIDETNDHLGMQYYQEIVDQLIIEYDSIPKKIRESVILEYCRLATTNNLNDEKLKFLIQDIICNYSIYPYSKKSKQEKMIDQQQKDEMTFYLAQTKESTKGLSSLKKDVKYVKIPLNITQINQNIFEGFKNIERMSLHENVKCLLDIETRNTKLREIIVFPSKNSETKQILHKISEMKNVKAFLQFPNEYRVEVIFKKSFQFVHLPPEIISIPDFFFHDCVELKNIKFSEGLKKIGQFSFIKCTLLNEIVLPESLIEIGDSAFACCSSLEKIQFNKNLSYIGSNAFSECKKLSVADLSHCINLKVNVEDFPETCNVILPKLKI